MKACLFTIECRPLIYDLGNLLIGWAGMQWFQANAPVNTRSESNLLWMFTYVAAGTARLCASSVQLARRFSRNLETKRASSSPHGSCMSK